MNQGGTKSAVGQSWTIGSSLPEGQRVYAVGDIHGTLKPLRVLLDRLAADRAAYPAAHVTLVYLGDYIDRGPASAEVLDLVLQRPAFADDVVRLLGNHEDMFQSFLARGPRCDQFLVHGGFETLQAYGIEIPRLTPAPVRTLLAEIAAERLPASHRALLESKSFSVSIGGLFFCHAGVRPGVALDAQTPADLMWIRDDFLCSRDDFGKFIVHGHTKTATPDLRSNRLNIDTGAHKSGRLTAAAIDGNRIRILTS